MLTPSPVAVFAAQHGLRVLKPARLADIAHEIAALQLDAVAVVAYGGLVPPNLLDVPTYGWINLHFSLLPAWRGAAPVQRAIIAGDDATGACTFRIEAGLDTGPVFGFVTRDIQPTDTAGSVLEALSVDGAQLLANTITHLGELVPEPQAHDGVSVAPKLTKDDARIRWSHPALAIDRLIRGCTPEPGAWTEVNGQRVEVGPLELRPDVQDLACGYVVFDGRRVHVGTGSHAVELRRVKPAGKPWMDADAWARGVRDTIVFTDER